VTSMMDGYAWELLEIPGLPNLKKEDPEVQKLIGRQVCEMGGSICRWDLLIKKILVEESGITAVPDLTGTAADYVMPLELQEEIQKQPLPEGVWAKLVELNARG
jgi:hypothetical protein